MPSTPNGASPDGSPAGVLGHCATASPEESSAADACPAPEPKPRPKGKPGPKVFWDVKQHEWVQLTEEEAEARAKESKDRRWEKRERARQQKQDQQQLEDT